MQVWKVIGLMEVENQERQLYDINHLRRTKCFDRLLLDKVLWKQ